MPQTVKPSLEVTWDAEIKAVRATGSGYVDGQYYRDTMDKGLALLKEKKASKWLADMREQKVLSQEDQTWTVQDWTPRSVKAGIRHTAFVIPASALGQMSLKRILSKVGEIEIVMAYFDNLEEARIWLRNF
jgi:hypothetical protein